MGHLVAASFIQSMIRENNLIFQVSFRVAIARIEESSPVSENATPSFQWLSFKSRMHPWALPRYRYYMELGNAITGALGTPKSCLVSWLFKQGRRIYIIIEKMCRQVLWGYHNLHFIKKFKKPHVKFVLLNPSSKKSKIPIKNWQAQIVNQSLLRKLF